MVFRPIKYGMSLRVAKSIWRLKQGKLKLIVAIFYLGACFLKIINARQIRRLSILIIFKNVSSLLTIFFSDVSSNLHDFLESEKVKISKDEINRLMTVRKYLDIDLAPPTFTSLTKIALMSSTSLKTKFKKMYGTTVFEYFQSMRMQRACILYLPINIQ